ncbi:MAG: aldehyde dehydrogenase family protein [Nocardioidaceae bacterium]
MSALDLLAPDRRGLFINGQWREAAGGKRFQVKDPADGSVITDVADGDPEDALAALDAAVAVQSDWAKTAPRERGEILRKAFELLTARADDFAELMSLEMGKTIAEARGELTYGAEFFRWFSEEAVRIQGRWLQAPGGGSRLLTIRKPAGLACSCCRNFPARHGHPRKMGPAIAAGCTMVVKPAGLTLLTTLALAGLMQEAGLFLTASSTSSPPITRPRCPRRSWPTSGCARSASPGRRRSARCWCASPPASSSG